MPKSPSGKKRPADVASNAVYTMRIAVGEIHEELPIDAHKNPAAVALGRMGGKARATALSKRKRVAIAKEGASKRWQKTKKLNKNNNFPKC